jgi:hypothetical protein
MANRNYNQFQLTLEKSVVTLYATIDLAAGTPVLKSWSVPATGGAGSYATTGAAFKGIKSVTHAATGKYTITLTDNFVRLLDVGVTCTNNNGSAVPTARGAYVLSETVNSSTTPGLVIVTTDTGGIATAGGANDRLLITLQLANSTAP